MTTYRIKLANGKIAKVDGPPGATEDQLMQAVAGNLDPVDLGILRSKNDPFGAFLRAQATAPVEGESDRDRDVRLGGEIPKPEVGAIEGTARSFLQGGSFGAGDEAVAAATAGLDTLHGRYPDRSYGELYDARVGAERDKMTSFRESNPALAMSSEIAGAIPPAILASPAAVTGGVGRRMLGNMAVGGGQGAVYGFNVGEGNLEDRALSAGTTGLLSGAIGGAVPMVGAAAKNVYNATLGSAAAAKVAGMPRQAFEFLSEAVRADGPRAAQRLAAAGDQGMLADAGRTTASAADFLAQRPGPSQQIIGDAVERRVNAASQRITGVLDDTLGVPQGVRQTARDIAQSTSTVRGDAYDTAYDTAIDYADDAGRGIQATLDRIPNRIMREAIETANEEMQAAGLRNQQILIKVADDGAVTFSELMNVRQLDQIKRALGTMGRESVDQFGRRTAAGNRAAGLARDLRQAITDAVPDYGVAVQLGGDKIARDSGLALGAKLLRPGTTRETTREFVDGFGGKLPDDVLEAVKNGVRANIDDTLANVKRTIQDPNVDAREGAKAVKDLSSRANKEKLRLILGDEAELLFKEIDRAATAFNLQAKIAENTKTAVRLRFKDRFDQTGSVVDKALRGETLKAPQALARGLLGRTDAALRGKTDKEAMAMAQALMRQGLPARDTLRALQQHQSVVAPKAANVQRLAEQLLRANTGVTAPAFQGFVGG